MNQGNDAKANQRPQVWRRHPPGEAHRKAGPLELIFSSQRGQQPVGQNEECCQVDWGDPDAEASPQPTPRMSLEALGLLTRKNSRRDQTPRVSGASQGSLSSSTLCRHESPGTLAVAFLPLPDSCTGRNVTGGRGFLEAGFHTFSFLFGQGFPAFLVSQLGFIWFLMALGQGPGQASDLLMTELPTNSPFLVSGYSVRT